jgi:hypothetical protein
MQWAQQFSDLTIRFYEAIRSREAGQATKLGRTSSLASLRGQKYALVVTYRKSGHAVPTPVWFGLDDDRLYFRSVDTGRKLARIASNPQVLVAPCTANGRPTGPSVPAFARLLTSSGDEARAEAAIRANYGISRRIYMRAIASRVAGRYVEVHQQVKDDERDL